MGICKQPLPSDDSIHFLIKSPWIVTLKIQAYFKRIYIESWNNGAYISTGNPSVIWDFVIMGNKEFVWNSVFLTHIVSLLKAIYSVVFVFVSPFLKNLQEVEQWNVDLFISLIPGALNEVSRVSLASRNKGLKWYSTLNFSDNFFLYPNFSPILLTILECKGISWGSQSVFELLLVTGTLLRGLAKQM